MASFTMCLKWFLVTVLVLDVSAADIQPCKKNDDACFTKSAKAALPLIVAGNPALGVKSSDPLYIDQIDGNLSILKFTFSDSVTTGIKNCDINDVKLDMEKLTLRFNLNCPDIIIKGNYFMNGRLIILPVEGNGTFSIFCKRYLIGVDSEIKVVKGKDEKDHLQIKNFKLALEARERITYDFKNLFYGREDLANTVLTFANQSWKEVADFTQEPLFNEMIKKIISNVKKYLLTVPIEDLFIQ